MPRPEFLIVLPNPWTNFDSDGQTYADPAGFVLHDLKIYGPESQNRVGVSIERVDILQPAKGRIIGQGDDRRELVHRPAIQRTRYRYADEPLKVHNNTWYRREVALGHLIACDAETAAQCGIAPEEFREATAVLSEIRAQAIAQFAAENPNAPMPSAPLCSDPMIYGVPPASAIADAQSDTIPTSTNDSPSGESISSG